MKIILTGCCGFIFYNFLKTALITRPEDTFVGIDKCDEPINLKNILQNTDKYKFYLTDICDVDTIDNIFKIEKPDIIIHAAALSFVCSSIEDPLKFIHSNVLGTQVLIDAAVKHNIKRFVYISSDEVYGSLGVDELPWDEKAATCPSSPYSASKLSGEHIVRAAHRTYGLNYNITRCSNVYGPHQNTRNLIPKVITSILNNKTINMHDRGEPVREWIYVNDKISAIFNILDNGKLNETYNIGSGIQYKNIDIYNIISKIMNKTTSLELNNKRLGQDWRYSISCNKLKTLGWNALYSFEDGIKKTIDWYIKNEKN